MRQQVICLPISKQPKALFLGLCALGCTSLPVQWRNELLNKLANGRKQRVIKEVWNFISFMISFPKGLNLCDKVVEQIPAESEFIPIKKGMIGIK